MIQDLLNQISSLDVKTIAFDMKNSTIRVNLEDERIVEFADVVSFFYTDEEVAYPSNLALKPIVYDAAGFDSLFATYDGEVSDDDDVEFEAFSIPNFSLCVDDRSMLIEAGKVKIFGNTYMLSERMQ